VGERLEEIRRRQAEHHALVVRARSTFPRRTPVTTTVVEVHRFGLTLELPDHGPLGFMNWTNVDPTGTPIRFGAPDAPAVGDVLRAVVVDDHEGREQLQLSCRLEHFPAPPGE